MSGVNAPITTSTTSHVLTNMAAPMSDMRQSNQVFTDGDGAGIQSMIDMLRVDLNVATFLEM